MLKVKRFKGPRLCNKHNLQTKGPGKSDFYFLNTVKEEGGNGPLMREEQRARDPQQRPGGH